MPKKQTQHGATAKGRGTAPSRTSSANARSTKSKRPAKRSPKTQATAARAARWWLIPVAVSVGLALFVLGYYPVARVQYRAVRERERLEAELSAIQARNGRLAKRVDALRTPEGVEEEARRQFGMVKSGEHLGVVVDGDENRANGPVVPRIDSDEITVAAGGPWTAFLDGVFGVSE
jgi:cell division protein FtsB